MPSVTTRSSSVLPHLPSLLSSLKTPDGKKLITVIRKSDGYIDATRMCKAAGKEVKDYLRIKRTAQFIEYLESAIPESQRTQIETICETSRTLSTDLIKMVTTGVNELRGTWIHPHLAIDLAAWLSPQFYYAMVLHTQSQLINEAIADKEQTVIQLQDDLDLKVSELTSLTEALKLKDTQVSILTQTVKDKTCSIDYLIERNVHTTLDNNNLKKSFFHPSAYSIEDWQDISLIRCYYQSAFRQIGAFLVRRPENRLRDEFVRRMEMMMIVVLDDVSICRRLTPISAYRLLCNCIKARYFHRRSITDNNLIKATTSSFISPYEFYFILVQFQTLLKEEGEKDFGDSMNSSIEAIEEKFDFNPSMLDEELTVVVADWI